MKFVYSDQIGWVDASQPIQNASFMDDVKNGFGDWIQGQLSDDEPEHTSLFGGKGQDWDHVMTDDFYSKLHEQINDTPLKHEIACALFDIVKDFLIMLGEWALHLVYPFLALASCVFFMLSILSVKNAGKRALISGVLAIFFKHVSEIY